MRIEIYDALPDQAKQIRIAVFMQEQGFTEEFDIIDEVATHFVLFDGPIPVATCRIWLDGDGYHVGRFVELLQQKIAQFPKD